tara:strand:+ start:350 stop:601 length:252 start_codon:yes stop_codon:yes gene_type:complete
MNDIEKEQLKIEIQHIFDSGANEIRIFEMAKSFIESRNGVNKLPIHGVSNRRELLKAFGEWYNGCTLSNPINMKNIDNYINSL